MRSQSVWNEAAIDPALGGSSLDAVMLCARIGEQVGMPITGADFMKYPSVAKFSDWIFAAWKKFAEAPTCRSWRSSRT